MTTQLLEPHKIEVPKGGCYESDQNADGTWNVRDVPVFVATKEPYTKDWLQGAVEVARLRFSEQHVNPLHAHHHNFARASEVETDEVLPAGLFHPTRVGEIYYEGELVPAIFADFLAVPDEIYQRIRAGEFKYRSVEILDNRIPEISSCALLSHECPRYRLPMVTIGRENGRSLVAAEPTDPDHCAVFVFRALEESVADPKKPADAPKPEKNDESPSDDGGSTDAFAAAADKIVGAIKDGNSALMQSIQALHKKYDDASDAEADDDQGDSGDDSSPDSNDETSATDENGGLEAKAKKNAAEPRKQDKVRPVEVARATKEEPVPESFRAQLRALESRAATAEKFAETLKEERRVDRSVRNAIARLQKIGAKIDEKYEGELRARALKSDEVLEEHVVTREKFGALEPPAWSGDARPPRRSFKGELDAFQKKHPELAAEAAVAAEEYEQMPEVMRDELARDVPKDETPFSHFLKYAVKGTKGVQHNGTARR